MTLSEALQKATDGFKITHRSFEEGEYLHEIDGVLHSEDGFEITEEFWSLRKGSYWENDWEVFDNEFEDELNTRFDDGRTS